MPGRRSSPSTSSPTTPTPGHGDDGGDGGDRGGPEGGCPDEPGGRDTEPELEPEGPAEPEPEIEDPAEPELEAEPGPDADAAESPRPACPYTSMISGGGTVPAPLLAELRQMGVAVRPVLTAADVTATPSYRPTAGQQRFVRTRDMTCRFPGCDHPAEFCDVDHTNPYDANGLTHPSNLKTLCRKHHLLKTFWVGRGGWTDEQHPDGTIVWTTPTGRRKTVPPDSRVHFPDWDTTTPTPTTPTATASAPRNDTADRGLTMPRRRRTRAHQQRATIAAERERNRKAAAANPPPF